MIKFTLIVSIFSFILCYSCEVLSMNIKSDTLYAKDYRPKDAGNFLNELVEMASSGGVIILEPKTYMSKQVRISKPLKFTGSNNTKIAPVNGSVFNALIIATQPFEIDNIILDGQERIFWGIYSTSDLRVENSTITKFFGNDSAPGNGIRHLTKDNDGCLIVTNSIIEEIGGYEDGKVGNYVGAHRGILTGGGDIFISNTKFKNILGEEDADCIHIQTKPSKTDAWTSAGKVLIEKCTFVNFGKRAIKVQGSDVVIRDNEIRNEGNKIYSAISLYGSRNLVEGNQVDVANATAALTVISGVRNRLFNNTITINREVGRQSWGVAFDKASRTNLSGNTFITNGKRTPFSYSKDVKANQRRSMERNNSVQIKR